MLAFLKEIHPPNTGSAFNLPRGTIQSPPRREGLHTSLVVHRQSQESAWLSFHELFFFHNRVPCGYQVVDTDTKLLESSFVLVLQ